MDQTDVTGPARHQTMPERMKGAALLDVATYEEVEHDQTATAQAAGVVGIVAICSGLGSLSGGIGGFFTGLIGAYVGWGVWSGVTYLIGDKVFGGTATWGELLRTIGFAQTPGIILVLGIIPLIGFLVYPVAWIWMLVTGVVAIRQALDFSTGKAVLTAILGIIAYMIVALVLGSIFGLGSMI